jgi:hypothetical protein
VIDDHCMLPLPQLRLFLFAWSIIIWMICLRSIHFLQYPPLHPYALCMASFIIQCLESWFVLIVRLLLAYLLKSAYNQLICGTLQYIS